MRNAGTVRVSENLDRIGLRSSKECWNWMYIAIWGQGLVDGVEQSARFGRAQVPQGNPGDDVARLLDSGAAPLRQERFGRGADQFHPAVMARPRQGVPGVPGQRGIDFAGQDPGFRTPGGQPQRQRPGAGAPAR